MKKISVCLIVCALLCTLFTGSVICENDRYQTPNPQLQSTLNPIWNRTWGGSSYDYAYSITIDGSYIYVAGYTHSFGAGIVDAVILKYDLDGNLIWNKTWGGSIDDYVYSITVDGSYIYVAGYTYSFGAGRGDAVILKYDLNGNLIWYKTWGGSDLDWAYSIAVDGSYIYAAGWTNSFGAGGWDVFVLKTDLEGGSGVISDFVVLIVLVILIMSVIIIVAVFALRRVKLWRGK
jgi:hypothetical protein